MTLPKISLALLTSCLLSATVVQATPMTGLLNMSGTATFNKSFATASGVTKFIGVRVDGGNTGAFSNIALNTPVKTASNYLFSPSTSTTALWSVAGFTFDLLSSTVVQQNANFLLISGIGTISGNGFNTTQGVWAFSSQSAGGRKGSATFTFSTNNASVPDGGATVLLLGSGLLGVGLLRLKIRKAISSFASHPTLGGRAFGATPGF
jgi:hypothetical protein